MAVLVDESTRVVVHGITGKEGSFHARQCIQYGTKVVAGVTPGKGGSLWEGVPVFDTVARAVKETRANTSLIFVPAPFAADSMLEAIEAGVDLIICITEGIPARDMLQVKAALKGSASRVIGPNCPGVISPGKAKVGIMPGAIFREGNIGVISRSGTLTYEIVDHLTQKGLGQSTCVGIGGDPIVGSSFVEILDIFARDPQTQLVVLIGEIGGTAEQEAAQLVMQGFPKPVTAFIAGQSAPAGKRMGHAGAIISGGRGTALEKMRALERAGIPVARTPDKVAELVQAALS
ncbi:MAG: succinate--CoA ligase subunit alpha [bacterium]